MNCLDAMQLFLQVVAKGSFTAAAERLQLRSPFVTQAIQGLEQELGVSLLNRTTRKLSVTHEGEDLCQRVRCPHYVLKSAIRPHDQTGFTAHASCQQ